MAFQWRNSIYKQLTRNRKSLLHHLPASLQKAMVAAWNQHYEELYESESEQDRRRFVEFLQGFNDYQSLYRFFT